MASKPILDLSTLVETRPPITIDGATYHLKSPEELTLIESQRFTSWGKELEALAQDEEAADAMTALVGVVSWAALADVPKAVFEKLSPVQRLAIIEVFTGLRLGGRLRLAGAISEQAIGQRIGASSSLGSSTSSAAILAGGSMAPRQPS